MEKITLKINGVEISVPQGSTILEAARAAHIEIPTLCFLKEDVYKRQAEIPAHIQSLRTNKVRRLSPLKYGSWKQAYI